MRLSQWLLVASLACGALLSACSPSKADIEAESKKVTQQIIDGNPALKPLGLVVDRVDAIHEEGNKYKGIAQVTLDGEHHQVPVSILADGDKILVTTEEGAFAFAAGKLFAKAVEDAGKELDSALVSAPAPPDPAPVPAAAPAQPAPAAPMVTETVNPSFDCAKASSTAERLICADAELAEMDADLGKLFARAKTAAKDAAAFNVQAKERWRQREAECSTKSCLVAWYTLRRGELLAWLPG